MLPDRGKIDVVLDGDVDAEPRAQRGPHVQAIQSGDIGRDRDAAGRRLNDAGTSHHAAAQPLRGHAGALKQGVGHAPDLSDDGAAAIARRRFNALGDDHALQIGKGDVQFGAAEVDAQHEGRVWPQRIGYGATPHGALDLPVLVHPAVAFKLAHHLRDGLLGQAGAAGDFGAGHRSIPQQALDHEADGLLSRNGRGGEILHEASPIGQDDELISRAEWRQVAFKVAVVLFLSRILRNTG